MTAVRRGLGFWWTPDHPGYPEPQDLVDDTWDEAERHHVVEFLGSGHAVPFAYYG